MALKGVVLDAGHGGVDPGAVANNVKEKDYNLLINNYIYKRLKELGIPVSVTREDDSTLDPTQRVKKALSFYGNDGDVLLLSNHINAGGVKSKNVVSKKFL
ncbi:MAG: N-acetylmuramoyl-L-alanine amidase [Bacilli bacterium]